MSDPAPDPRRALAKGRQLGKYRLEYLLGAGGMGTVWAAHDDDLDRRVAIKVLNLTFVGDEVARVRLVREAQAMARLRHPNVITVFDATTIEGHNLVAMELVDGETLANWLEAETRDPGAVFEALIAAGRGLAAAHAAGMIHRDFKPQNVLVENGGRVLVTDFGLARASGEIAEQTAPEPRPSRTPAPDDAKVTAPERPSAPSLVPEPTLRERPASAPRPSDSAPEIDDTVVSPSSRPSDRAVFATPLTHTGVVLGTPAYMAPEQFRGELADARADQFAFCVTAWEALAGERPFTGPTFEALAIAVDSGTPAHAERIPRKLRALLERGLAKDPAARWPSMNELLTAMEHAWRGNTARRNALLGLGALFAATFVITIVATRTGKDRAPEPPRVAPAACPAGRDALATVWSPDVREKLGRLANHPAGAMAIIDRWATSWVETYDANCRQPEGVDFVARRLCLEAQRDDLGVMFGDVAAAARGIQRAELGRMMPSPVACQRSPRAIAPPMPADPALRKRISELRIALHVLKTDTYLRAGTQSDFLRRGDALVAQALATEYPPVHAEALYDRALVSLFGADGPAGLTDAFDRFGAAANVAEAAGYDRIRVDSQLGQLECGIVLQRESDLDDLVRRAEVAATRLGDPTPELVLEMLRAVVALHRGQWSDAVKRAEHARLGWQERGATDTMARSAMLEAQARHLRHAGDDLDRALAAITAGLAGEQQPQWKIALLRERGMIEWRRGRIAEARAAFAAAGLPTTTLDGGGGDPAGGTLRGTIAELPVGSAADPTTELERATRRSLPLVVVRAGEQSWTVPVRLDGTWTLDHLAPGSYTVSVIVDSARGDTQLWRSRATVTGSGMEVASGSIATTLTPGRIEPSQATSGPIGRIVVLYPGTKLASSAAALRTQLAAAPWLSAIALGSRPASLSEVTALGAEPAILCELAGATIEADRIVIPDAPALSCTKRSPAP